MKRSLNPFALAALACLPFGGLMAAESLLPSLVRVVDLDVGETQAVTLSDKASVRVKLLSLDEARDALRGAVREARVHVEVEGRTMVLTSATYHLPVKLAGIQIDCPITKGHVTNSSEGNAWGLVKEARLRLWPAGSPWIEPGTFVYPLKQRWFASHTQMANEPSFVDLLPLWIGLWRRRRPGRSGRSHGRARHFIGDGDVARIHGQSGETALRRGLSAR
jgi:hypothetical protein